MDHVLDNSKKYLYIGNSGILSVVIVVVVIVCILALAYTSLCRGLEYLLKVRYTILVDPNGVGFLIFETIFLGSLSTLPYFWKVHHNNLQHLCLKAQL